MLLQISNLAKYYGANPVLVNTDLTIQPGEKWALVGRNGSGKSTLLKIMTNREEADQGMIAWAQKARIGFVEQNPIFNSQKTIYQELRALFAELDNCQARLTELQAKMSQPGLDTAVLETYLEESQRLNDFYEKNDGYQIESRIQGVLRGLGIPQSRWQEAADELSGGEKTRLALARLLLNKHDILLLDEPTNHLDIQGIEWLEAYLVNYPGAVLLISHDRIFLDKIVTGIYEIESGKIKKYKGNYSAYRKQKEAYLEAAQKAYGEQEKEVARLEKFVRESRATEKAKRKAHSIEKRLAQINRVAKVKPDTKGMKIQFQTTSSLSRDVLELESVSKSYAAKVLLKQANISLKSGQKIGLVGPNGSGKTTLLEMILGRVSPDQGLVRFGAEVYPGYFSQIETADELTETPFDQIMNVADLTNTEARTLLGRFLFSGDDVFKQVRDLSGGEKKRLGLLKLMLSKTNLLILDEPTNHLDLLSIEVLEKALQEYQGTVLMVSHDRYFLQQIVDSYWGLNDGQLKILANYHEYLFWQNTQNNEADPKKQLSEKTDSRLSREQAKEFQRELKRKKRKLNDLEADINTTEARKTEILELLNQEEVFTDYQKSLQLSEELPLLEEKLKKNYQNWEVLWHELDAFIESDPNKNS